MMMTPTNQLMDLIRGAVHARPIFESEHNRVEIVDLHKAMHCCVQWDVDLIVFVRRIEPLSSLCEYAFNRERNPIDCDAAPCRIDLAKEVACRGRAEKCSARLWPQSALVE